MHQDDPPVDRKTSGDDGSILTARSLEPPHPALHLARAQLSVAPFSDEQIGSFSKVNVFIGPNGIGKSRLLRSLFDACQERAKYLFNEKFSGTSPFRTNEGVALFPTPQEELGGGKHWVFAVHGGEVSRMPDQRVALGVLAEQPRHNFRHGDPMRIRLNDEEDNTDVRLDFESALARANSSRPRGDIQSSERSDCIFILGHRRGSDHQQELAAHHRLKLDASNIQGRISTLFGEKRHRDAVNDAMSHILPSVDQIGFKHVVERDNAGDPTNTFVEVEITTKNHSTYSLLESGGGVEQVLAIIVALTSESAEGIIFLDEPEAHLHEGAQRRLANYIRDNIGRRQVFISTHSPVFMTAFSDASIFRVTKHCDGSVSVVSAIEKEDQRAVLGSLGCEAKSILQANAAIWVEGPTEITILRYMLTERGLMEHEDYEFLMTGGSNLKHFGIDDKGSTRIQMLRVCRNSFGIFDRDHASSDENLKEAVQRLVKTLQIAGRHHVTKHYEFEWYYPEEALSSIFGLGRDKLNKDEAFSSTIKNAPKNPSLRKDKVALATRVLEEWGDETAWPDGFTDLLDKLDSFIRSGTS